LVTEFVVSFEIRNTIKLFINVYLSNPSHPRIAHNVLLRIYHVLRVEYGLVHVVFVVFLYAAITISTSRLTSCYGEVRAAEIRRFVVIFIIIIIINRLV